MVVGDVTSVHLVQRIGCIVFIPVVSLCRIFWLEWHRRWQVGRHKDFPEVHNLFTVLSITSYKADYQNLKCLSALPSKSKHCFAKPSFPYPVQGCRGSGDYPCCLRVKCGSAVSSLGVPHLFFLLCFKKKTNFKGTIYYFQYLLFRLPAFSILLQSHIWSIFIQRWYFISLCSLVLITFIWQCTRWKSKQSMFTILVIFHFNPQQLCFAVYIVNMEHHQLTRGPMRLELLHAGTPSMCFTKNVFWKVLSEKYSLQQCLMFSAAGSGRCAFPNNIWD